MLLHADSNVPMLVTSGTSTAARKRTFSPDLRMTKMGVRRNGGSQRDKARYLSLHENRTCLDFDPPLSAANDPID